MKSAMDVFAQKKSQKTILIPKFVIISNLYQFHIGLALRAISP